MGNGEGVLGVRGGMLLYGSTAIPLSHISSVDQAQADPQLNPANIIKGVLAGIAACFLLGGVGLLQSAPPIGIVVMLVGVAGIGGVVWFHQRTPARPPMFHVVLSLNSGEQRLLVFGTPGDADMAAKKITAAIVAAREQA